LKFRILNWHNYDYLQQFTTVNERQVFMDTEVNEETIEMTSCDGGKARGSVAITRLLV